MLHGAWCKSSPIVLAIGALACPSAPAEPAEDAQHEEGTIRASDRTPFEWAGALDRAIERSIVPSETDDGTYRVDAFVAVLLFEHLRETRGKPIFTAIEARDHGTSPAGGFMVGPLDDGSIYHRLGLREGDVVESINGVELGAAGPPHDRFATALAGSENQVTVSLIRDGFSMTMAYRLVETRTWTRLLAEFVGPEPDAAAPDEIDEFSASPPISDAPVPQGAGPAPMGSSPPRAAPSAKPRTGSGKPPSRTSFVQCESSNACTVAKTHFDAMVANPSRLQSEVEIVPAVRNDVHSGYRLRTVRPGTSVADLGFRSGDKITHVNGYDLTNDAQALQLYLSLAGSRTFEVRYERGTRRLTKTIRIR